VPRAKPRNAHENVEEWIEVKVVLVAYCLSGVSDSC
jgi:hypothetical protein